MLGASKIWKFIFFEYFFVKYFSLEKFSTVARLITNRPIRPTFLLQSAKDRSINMCPIDRSGIRQNSQHGEFQTRVLECADALRPAL